MKISIIIPVYNVEEYIERCILSVINQTYTNIEIIIINDCTPDKSMEIIAKIVEEKEIKNINIIHHDENKGLSGARNTGIDNSTGNYILFLDSDDELPVDAVSNLAHNISSQKPDFIIGKVITTGSDMEFNLDSDNSIVEGYDIFRAYLASRLYVMAWNKLVNRDFLIRNNLYFIEGIIHEDIIWFFNLTHCSRKMITCPFYTYIYHIRKASISQTVKEKNIRDLLFSFKYINDKLSDIYYEHKEYILSYIITMRFYILENSVHLGYNFWKETYNTLKKNDKTVKKNIFLQKNILLKLKLKYILYTFLHPLILFKILKAKRTK